MGHQLVFAVHTVVERGYACSVEVIESTRDSSTHFYVAFYSPPVLANGWQPYDQPSPAAYLPFAFADSARETVRGGGQVLVQRAPARGMIGREFTRVTSLRKALEKAFSQAGAPASAATRALRMLGDGRVVQTSRASRGRRAPRRAA